MNLGTRTISLLAFCGLFFSTHPQAHAAVTFAFTNTSPLAINDSLSPPTPAAPYPSLITVTGLTGQVVTKLTVAIRGLTHTFPSDVSVLLVGPLGQTAMVMSEVGGQNQYSVTNVTLTLDDDASSDLPVYTNLVTGTFRPTNGYRIIGSSGLPYDFPAPAPAGTSNAVSAFLSFKNTDPSGPWKLFVVDDGSGSSGSIAGGWSLSVSVTVPLQIVRFGTNAVISWPASAQNSTLQAAPSLSNPTGWTNVPSLPVQVSNRLVVTNAISGNSKYFRLVQP